MKKRLPTGMLQRVLTMGIWLVAASFTSFDAMEFGPTIILFGLVGVGIALFVYILWGQRTRPARNAFWFLVHVVLVGAIIGLATSRPLLGLVAAIPVALLWIHDSPASPTAMLSWGVVLILWQPSLWRNADPSISSGVVVATLLMITAAQFERNRLAARQYTQAGVLFSFIRLAAVTGITALFVAGREGLRAVNVFTYLGIDASGIGGKLTMLGFIVVSLALALALFRVRPETGPKLIIADAAPRPGRAPQEPARTAIDFDEAPAKVAKRVDNVTHPSTRLDKAAQANRQTAGKAPKPKKPASRGPAKPGELDFD